MTNQAIAAILEHLSVEARNSAHAAFGVMELLRDFGTDSARQVSMAIGTATPDRMLRDLDDVRDLLSHAPPPPARLEEFDLVMCVAEIIEVLNLASGLRTKHMILDAPPDPLPVTQDRHALEQVLTRILGAAFKLTETNAVRVPLIRGSGKYCARLEVAARDPGLAVRITGWLNADPDQVELQDPGDVTFGIAVMVAGKRLRELGGSAELVHHSIGQSAVALDLPRREIRREDGPSSGEQAQPAALSILVAEDCDDSFALTELMLQSEHVSRASDGLEALAMIHNHRFDLVLMDVHMPDMDGYSVIRNIRDWETQTGNARTPIVVLSSDDLETQRRSAAEIGCSGFLRKPTRRCDLANLLDRLKDVRTLMA